MATPTLPRTAAATEASIVARARRRAADPGKRTHATLAVAAGMVDGTITMDDLAAQVRRVQGEPDAVAASAPAPDPDRLARIRDLLPPVPLSETEASAA